MNINENYQLPSEIYDSFQEGYGLEQQHEQQAFVSAQNLSHSSDIDNSLQDDNFLAQFKKIGIRNKQSQNRVNQTSEHSNPLYVDKTLIELSMVPFKQYYHPIKVTNTSGNAVKMRLPQCPFDISCAHHMIFSSGTYEFILDPWQIIQLLIKINKKEGQYGDLYETITILQQTIVDKSDQRQVQANVRTKTQTQALARHTPIHIRVQVKFVQPQLRLKFTGCTDILTASGQMAKIALAKVQANKLGEYQVEIEMGGTKVDSDKLDLSIQARGRCSVYPQSLTLGKDAKRLNLRSKGKDSHRAALILRVTGTPLCYVFGIQFI